MSKSRILSSRVSFRSLSRRLDAASGAVSTGLILLAVVFGVIGLFVVILPANEEVSVMRERLKSEESELNRLNEQSRYLNDWLKALDDPYNIAQIAIDRYGFRRIEGPLG